MGSGGTMHGGYYIEKRNWTGKGRYGGGDYTEWADNMGEGDYTGRRLHRGDLKGRILKEEKIYWFDSRLWVGLLLCIIVVNVLRTHVCMYIHTCTSVCMYCTEVHSGLIWALRCHHRQTLHNITKVRYKMYHSEKKSISHTVNSEFTSAHGPYGVQCSFK